MKWIRSSLSGDHGKQEEISALDFDTGRVNTSGSPLFHDVAKIFQKKRTSAGRHIQPDMFQRENSRVPRTSVITVLAPQRVF